MRRDTQTLWQAGRLAQALGFPMPRLDTSHIAMAQPSATSWRTSSRPMPEPPPVTTAILPEKSFIELSSLAVTPAAIRMSVRQPNCCPDLAEVTRNFAPRATGVLADIDLAKQRERDDAVGTGGMRGNAPEGRVSRGG
jgi:hypothetical protein